MGWLSRYILSEYLYIVCQRLLLNARSDSTVQSSNEQSTTIVDRITWPTSIET